MKYSKVYIQSIGYELAPNVVTSIELEERIAPVYKALGMQAGQLEALTGIRERRWWDKGFMLSSGAASAAKKALEHGGVGIQDIGAVVYAGVCRENSEPATACAVADAIGAGTDALVYDIGNACLGVMNGILDIANRIELGQLKAGLVVSCESSREINDSMISHMLSNPSFETFRLSMATLTGGSGAVGVVVSDGSFSRCDGRRPHRLLGGACKADMRHHRLCRWNRDFMTTDAAAVLKNGVALGAATWKAALSELGWSPSDVGKVICHQVGGPHKSAVLASIGVPQDKDFSTYEFLGNIGTVSLPLTAAIAEERDFLSSGDKVMFMGIGSGLNCMMTGVEW